MKGISCVRRLRFGLFRGQSVPPLCFVMSGSSYMYNSMDLLNLWL